MLTPSLPSLACGEGKEGAGWARFALPTRTSIRFRALIDDSYL